MNLCGESQRMLMIDGTGPFFRFTKKKRINWSKIPFSDLETENDLRAEVANKVPEDFAKFAAKARALGYNAVTLDDVAHLVVDKCYPTPLREKLSAYRRLYAELFEIAKANGLSVFITMDIMFFNDALRRKLRKNRQRTLRWLNECLERLFAEFASIAGVIMRFGETDGVDVTGDFRSELWLRSPHEARKFLRSLLPTFERYSRLMVFRTWCVGAFKIGDLTWNQERFAEVFEGVDSPSLVISCKYGESDFFRYLPLNPLFTTSRHKKVIEFQARREYEGFGAYPSFIGWDTEDYLNQLGANANVIGMSVWCQTGGWGKRRQLTFVRNSSVWVELNTFVLARLWQGSTCEQAIEEFSRESMPQVPTRVLVDFLRRSDIVIKDLLYIRELAERQLYFRRLRLPPQLYVFWDRIIIDEMVRSVLVCLVQDKEQALEEAKAAFEELQTMTAMAEEHGIPKKGLKLQLATFEILLAAREYFFRPNDEAVQSRLRELKTNYQLRYKRHYAVLLNFDQSAVHKIPLRWLIPVVVRERSRYRVVDQVLTVRLLGLLYPLAHRFRSRLGPKFASKQAMGLEVLLK